MNASLGEINRAKPKRPAGENLPAAVTLPALRDGSVFEALGTIFTGAGLEGLVGYPDGDAEAAHEAGLRQLRVYHNWVHDSGVRLTRFDDGAPGDGDHAGDGAEGRAFRARSRTHTDTTIRLGILIENADPIRTPDELAWWVERGVVAVGMAWWTPSRYAGGNRTDTGLTDLGRALAEAMDALGVVHDLSHLSQRATDELLGATDRPVIASHSNCRALLGDRDNEAWQRHLSDESIAEVARRGGVIGLNLVRNFIRWRPGATPETLGRPSIDEALAHVERICEIAGHTRAVGLGSDMDGGISALDMCEGLESPSELGALGAGLAARGWTEPEIEGFARENWRRFFREFHASAP